MKKIKDNSYIITHRLTDIIRLIVVLSVDKHSFRSEDGLVSILHGKPKSVNSWLELAKEHQEFFRFNKEEDKIVLLIRFLQNVEVAEGELRPPLSVEETQKLVDQSIELHDKELARYQRDSAKTAIHAAYISAAAIIIVGLITCWVTANTNTDMENDIKIIKQKLEIQSKTIKKCCC